LLDSTNVVDVPHLNAAIALWNYAERSTRWIFGEALGDPTADTILRALKDCSPEAMDKEAFHALFQRHLKAAELDRALTVLEQADLIERVPADQSAGRPRQAWRFTSRVTSHTSHTSQNGVADSNPTPPASTHCEVSEESEESGPW
jgi:hypothetical protein